MRPMRRREGPPPLRWRPENHGERLKRWERVRREWLERRRHSPYTMQTRERASRRLGRFLAERNPAIPPWWTTREVVAEWMGHMTAEGLTEQRIQHLLAECATWYAYALPRFRGDDPEGSVLNPFLTGPAAGAPPEPPRGFWPLDADEVSRLFQILERRRSRSAARNQALLLTLLLTSVKPATVLQMRWGDIHYDGRDGEVAVVWREGQDSPIRTVLPVRAYWAIRRYLMLDGRNPKQLADDAYIWTPLSVHAIANLAPDYEACRLGKEPITVQSLRTMLRALLRAAHVRMWRVYGPMDLQHTFALHLYPHDGEIEALRSRWGYAHEPLDANYNRMVQNPAFSHTQRMAQP